MHDPWTQTMVGGLPDGVGQVLGGAGERRKNQDNCNSIVNKIKKEKYMTAIE